MNGFQRKTDNETSKKWPKRRKPASGVFISSKHPTIVFLTICTKNRFPWLANPEAHELLVNVWKESKAWLVGYYVLMPDHVHLFCAPNDMVTSLDNWVLYWKRLFSRKCPHSDWKWQSQKWDTRLRRTESYQEKWEYVRHNPVRKELVSDPDEWLYQGMLNELRW